MAWFQYTGPVDRVDMPRWNVADAPRMTPVEVLDPEAIADLTTHAEWEACDPPAEED